MSEWQVTESYFVSSASKIKFSHLREKKSMLQKQSFRGKKHRQKERETRRASNTLWESLPIIKQAQGAREYFQMILYLRTAFRGWESRPLPSQDEAWLLRAQPAGSRTQDSVRTCRQVSAAMAVFWISPVSIVSGRQWDLKFGELGGWQAYICTYSFLNFALELFL